VHFLRNVLARVPKGSAEMVAAAVRTIFAQPDAQHVRDQLGVIAGMLGRRFPAVETTLRDAEPELLAFAAFPVGHWKKIWSTDEIRNPSAWRGSCCPGPIPPRPARQAEIAGPQPGSRWSAPLDERP
jgi:hypothetical protein